MAAKSGGKMILGKVASRLCKYPVGQKFRQIAFRFQDKHVFAFKAEIQNVPQKWRENHFWEKLPVDSVDTLWVKNFVEIALSHSVSEINTFLRFMQKFKMAAKSGGKMIFGKSRQRLWRYPMGQRFCRNRSISLCFQDKLVFAFNT